jgi:hypothetical protein
LGCFFEQPQNYLEFSMNYTKQLGLDFPETKKRRDDGQKQNQKHPSPTLPW